MSTNGPNGAAGLWPALDRALTQGSIGKLALKEAQTEQTQKEGANSALGALMRGLSSGQSGGPVMPQIAQQKLGAMAFPDVAKAAVQQKVFPAAPKPMTVGKDERFGTWDGKAFNELLPNVIDPPKIPDILQPGVVDAQIRVANATRGPQDPGSFITLTGPDGKTWSGGDKTPQAQKLGEMGWKKTSETKPKTIADMYKDLTGTDVSPGYKAEVGPNGQPTGKMLRAEGGPADVGQKGLPQAYKQQTAGLDTLEQAVTAFRDKFAGTPAEMDAQGNVIKPAEPGTGTEMAGGDAGALDAMYTQIMLATKNAEQAGALDQGMLNVMDQMLRKPTGALSPFQNNDYTKGQINTILEGITRKRANLKKAFDSGSFDENGTPPQNGAQAGWTMVEVKP